MNPTAEASQRQQSELESCKQEVARLRERLRLVEEGVTQDLTLVVNDRVGGASSKEIEGAYFKYYSQISIISIVLILSGFN